jgi:hypothetical protein
MKRLLLVFVAVAPVVLQAADALTWEQKEDFLRNKKTKIVATHAAPDGTTGTVRVTMTGGNITHDASVQRINDTRTIAEHDDGTTELDYKDSYAFNIAGWRLARMLGLGDMVPPSVPRTYQGQEAAFTWWIEDVMMNEGQRRAANARGPHPDALQAEYDVVRVFDELIFNTDRNPTNVLIDKQWRLWMIDETRAFRKQKTLRTPSNLTRCDRDLLAKMKTLTKDALKKEMGIYLSGPEIDALLARRDLIVRFFESKGEKALFNRPARP